MSDTPRAREFTYHIRSGLSGITLGLVVLLAVEGFAVHVLLSLWKVWVAWIFTATTVLSAVWLVQQARACARRPILVTADTIVLRSGTRPPVELNRTEVIRVHRNRPDPKRPTHSMAFLTKANCWLELAAQREISGPMGTTVKAEVFALYVDDVEGFLRAIGDLDEC